MEVNDATATGDERSVAAEGVASGPPTPEGHITTMCFTLSSIRLGIANGWTMVMPAGRPGTMCRPALVHCERTRCCGRQCGGTDDRVPGAGTACARIHLTRLRLPAVPGGCGHRIAGRRPSRPCRAMQLAG